MKFFFTKSSCLCLSATSILFVHSFRSNGQIQSFPGYFTYYNPADPNNPPGSDTISKAIIFYVKPSPEYTSSGTMFLINTFRDDDTICACLAGHQMKAFFPNGKVTPGPFSGNFYFAMNYLGKDSVANINGINYHLNSVIPGTAKGVATGGELVAYYADEHLTGREPDISLILLDKRQLPLLSYATAGYDFDNTNWRAASYYSINHPKNYPQRIQDHYTAFEEFAHTVTINGDRPFCSASGSSGGPLIQRPSSADISGCVRGVASVAFEVPGNVLYDRLAGVNFPFFYQTGFTKIGTIENAIKRHCWKNKDSNEIILNGLQRKSVLINNATNITPYKQNRTITQTSDVTANAETGPSRNDTKSSYLKANQCNLNGFTLTATYPGSTESWQVTIAVKETGLINEFSYTPVGRSELNLSTVIINDGPAGSLSRKADNALSVADKMTNTTASQFKIYPNPSPDGTFHIALPDTEPYSVAVYTIDGKKIYENNCTENPFSLQLPLIARGDCLLYLYSRESKAPAYQQIIVY